MDNKDTQNQPTSTPREKSNLFLRMGHAFKKIGRAFQKTGTFLKSTVAAVLVGAIATTATFIIKGCHSVADAIVKAVDDRGYNKQENENQKEYIERLKEADSPTIRTAAKTAEALEPIVEPVKKAAEPVVRALDDTSLNQDSKESDEEYRQRLRENESPTIRAAEKVASWLEGLKGKDKQPQPLTPEQMKEIQERTQAQH